MLYYFMNSKYNKKYKTKYSVYLITKEMTYDIFRLSTIVIFVLVILGFLLTNAFNSGSDKL